MQTILRMRQEALPIVKSSLEMKRKALEFSTQRYRQRLAAFERVHRMTTKQFAKKFGTGELGDDAEWFEWEFALDALRETDRQARPVDSVKL